MPGGRCYLRRRHEQLARAEISSEGQEVNRGSSRKHSISSSFRAKRGIPLLYWQPIQEGFLASLGMTALGRGSVIGRSNDLNNAFRPKSGHLLPDQASLGQPPD